MPLDYAPTNTQIVTLAPDERGVMNADLTSEWMRWFARLRDEIVRVAQVKQKTIINTLDEIVADNATPSNGGWPTSNLAFFIPITVYEQITIKRMLIYVPDTTVWNLDLGIYRGDKSRVTSTGLIENPRAGAINGVGALNIDAVLDPGRYFAALALDFGTIPMPRLNVPLNRLFGVYEKTSSFPLPATATFIENATRQYIPEFALDSNGGQISQTLVGSASANAASGNLSVTPPTTKTQDILICKVTSADNVALSFPAGWTIYQEGNNTAGMRSTAAWKRATGAEGAFTITHTGGSFIRAALTVYRGCIATGSPIDASSIRHNAASTTCTADSIVVSNPNTMILFSTHCGSNATASTQAAADPATFLERVETSGDVEISISAGPNAYSLGGATGTATAALTASVLNTGILTALKPLVK